MDLGLDIRKEILARSLMMESLASIFLSGLLGIDDMRNSKTLGNTSSSLSFNQKLDLLLDLGSLSKDEKTKCITFMEIRNQFMHNLAAVSFEKCFQFCSGKETWILKAYKQPETDQREKQLQGATFELSSDVFSILKNVLDSVKIKFERDVNNKMSKKSHEAFIKSIDEAKDLLDKFVDDIMVKSDTIKTTKLKGMGTYVTELIFSLWKKNVKDD